MLSTKQKESIEILRRIGWGYKRIGNQIGATRDEVRCYCRSHDLMGKINVTKDKEIFITTHCKVCNKSIVQTFKGREKSSVLKPAVEVGKKLTLAIMNIYVSIVGEISSQEIKSKNIVHMNVTLGIVSGEQKMLK